MSYWAYSILFVGLKFKLLSGSTMKIKVVLMADIPVPAPSSNATIPSNSVEVNILCSTKSDNTSSALHTWRVTKKEIKLQHINLRETIIRFITNQ